MKISISESIGSRCIIKDDGLKIFKNIHDPLKNGEEVTLDFTKVTQFASPFFNFAIGGLLKDIKENDLKKLLHIENLNQTGQIVVKRVFENASRYYTDINYQEIVDSILEEQVKDPE